MFRGFRWQLVALLLAFGLFLVSLALRPTDTPPPSPTLAPTLESTSMPQGVIPVVVVQPTPAPVDPLVAAGEIVTFREAVIGEVRRLNPLLAPLNSVESDITALIFEGLTTTSAFGEPIPALAERWVISSDGLEYTVFLRRDVVWQDGTPFSAADVAYTMSILRAPDFPGSAELGAFWRSVETEVLDSHLVRFRLTQPLGAFLDKLRVPILPEHALRGTTAALLTAHPFNLTPIGTGPYQLEAIRTGGTGMIQAVDLRVAPNYRARPEAGRLGLRLERVSFQLFDTFDAALAALQSGSVDGLAARTSFERGALVNAAAASGLELHNTVEATLGVLIFNWVSEDTRFFREQRVRVALDTGLDRMAMIDRTLYNVAISANSPLMPGSWAYAGDLPEAPYDVQTARNLLVAAQERFDRITAANAPTPDPEATAEATAEAAPTAWFTFTILTPDDPNLSALANEIAAQWSQLNLDVRVEAVDLETYQARLETGDFDTAIVEYSLGGSTDPDVYAFWHQGQYPEGKNYGGADDRRTSELLESARRDPWGVNRARDYQQFQREFVARAIALPLYYPLYTYATAARLENVQLGFIGAPPDRFRSIGDWRIG